MTDAQLIFLLAEQMDAAVEAGGWDYPVIQKNQPTQEGIPVNPAVFFEKLFDHPYGYTSHELDYNNDMASFSETTTQVYETTFQISALVIQNPSDLTLPTASDVVNYVKMFIATPTIRQIFMAQNVGLLRVTQVRNPYFEDDRHRMEAHPSFDIVLTYNKDIEMQIPGTNIIDGDIYPVIDLVPI
jgi:hypothetical protein